MQFHVIPYCTIVFHTIPGRSLWFRAIYVLLFLEKLLHFISRSSTLCGESYYSMLLCAIPCYACHAIASNTSPWHFSVFHVIPCYSMLFHTVHIMPFLETLFDAVPYYSTLFHIIPCHSILYILRYNFPLFWYSRLIRWSLCTYYLFDNQLVKQYKKR